MTATDDIDDETLDSALAVLRDGVTTRSEENERVSILLDIARERDVPQQGIAHPKITQALFRYEFEPKGVRGEIDRAIETYDIDALTEEVLQVLVAGADRVEEGDDVSHPVQ